MTATATTKAKASKKSKAAPKAAKPKTTPKKKRIKFEIQAEKSSDVYVAGSFNGWDNKKNKLKYKDGIYSTSILLASGTYEYKFIVNDTWCVDPDCSEWAPNEFGSLNSIRTV